MTTGVVEPMPQPTNTAKQLVDGLRVHVESWEGPLDLLLVLARQQKVDLRQISILALVEQYLDFIGEMRALKLEVAADYLVMAAWLAYLKSALLLPKNSVEEPSPDEMALRLQLRLQRLDAMRESATRLMARDRVGRDNFLRGNPEGLRNITLRRWDASLFDLMQAYAHVKLRTDPVVHLISRRPVVTVEAAMQQLEKLLGQAYEWTELEKFLPVQCIGILRRSALASTFLAALELARQGKLDLEQKEAFSPLLVKAPKI